MKLLNPLNSEVATAIAAAVEQQAAATREIASSVQTVTAATHEATKAMQEVSSISENTDAASRKVLSGADEVNRNADTLRGEVTEFLQAMASTSDEDAVATSALQAIAQKRCCGRAAVRRCAGRLWTSRAAAARYAATGRLRSAPRSRLKCRMRTAPYTLDAYDRAAGRSVWHFARTR